MSLQCDVCLSRGKGNVFWGTDRMTDEFDTLPSPLFLMLSDISSIFLCFFFYLCPFSLPPIWRLRILFLFMLMCIFMCKFEAMIFFQFYHLDVYGKK